MEQPGDVFLSLIIPAYNEAAGIVQAIEEADAALRRLGRPYEVLVIDDGSTDATSTRVQEAIQNRSSVRLLVHDENQGYGAALRTGFAAARGQRIAFTDADCQFYLDDLAPLLSLTDDYDIAAGHRGQRQDSALRCFYSWGYNRIVRTLLGTGLRDCDCALKVFRREALAQILPESRGFFVNTEMITLARHKGLTVVEAPVRHRPRLRGESKVRWSDIPRTLQALLPFWWSRVLFPGVQVEKASAQRNAPSPPGTPGGEGWGEGGKTPRAKTPSPQPLSPGVPGARGLNNLTIIKQVALLFVVAVFLFFTRLDCALLEPDEARYAEIPRQMLAEGAFVTPVLNGSPYLHKPPLLYWLVMASYQVFGVHDWSARIVPATTGVLLVLLVYFWALRTVGARAAFWSALVLCLSARFVYQTRMIIMDGLLCLWVTAALAAGHLALHSGSFKRAWWILAALCCGLGLLTKGPVALLLVLGPPLLHHALEKRNARVSIRGWLCFSALAVGVAAPWYLALAIQHPSSAADFLWIHNVLRFVDPIDHSKPIWFYLPLFLMGTLPWIVLVVPALRKRADDARPAAIGFFALATLWPLVFFSLSDCKRPAYILPAFPPLALFAGTFFARRLSGSEWIWEGSRAVRVLRFACGAAVVAVFVVAVSDWLPDYHGKFGLRGQVQVHADLAANPELPVVCYPRGSESVSFYLQRSDVRTYSIAEQEKLVRDLQAQRKTLVFVRTGGALEELLKALPEDLKFLPRGREGKLTAALIERETASPAPD